MSIESRCMICGAAGPVPSYRALSVRWHHNENAFDLWACRECKFRWLHSRSSLSDNSEIATLYSEDSHAYHKEPFQERRRGLASFRNWLRKTAVERIRGVARREGFPVLDLSDAFLAAFRKSGPLELTYDCDGHWNARGHAISAGAIKKFLDDDGWINNGV